MGEGGRKEEERRGRGKERERQTDRQTNRDTETDRQKSAVISAFNTGVIAVYQLY